MYARMSTFENAAVALEGRNGLDHVHLMVKEETGRAVALSVWVDEETIGLLALIATGP